MARGILEIDIRNNSQMRLFSRQAKKKFCQLLCVGVNGKFPRLLTSKVRGYYLSAYLLSNLHKV